VNRGRGVVEEQIAYYRARAGEYDQWLFRQGRYDRGEPWNRLWFDEVEASTRWKPCAAKWSRSPAAKPCWSCLRHWNLDRVTTRHRKPPHGD
jgi:hypothetical protein